MNTIDSAVLNLTTSLGYDTLERDTGIGIGFGDATTISVITGAGHSDSTLPVGRISRQSD